MLKKFPTVPFSDPMLTNVWMSGWNYTIILATDRHTSQCYHPTMKKMQLIFSWGHSLWSGGRGWLELIGDRASWQVCQLRLWTERDRSWSCSGQLLAFLVMTFVGGAAWAWNGTAKNSTYAMMWTEFRKAAADQREDPLKMVAACKYLSVSVFDGLGMY